jgi:6-phosphogluconolactonase
MSGIAGTMNVSPDAGAMARAAADWFAQTLAACEGPLRVALTGGNTPRLFYTLLGAAAYRKRVPWNRIDFYFGDERFVPHDSPDSNFHMVRETLMAAAPVDPLRMHPMPVTGTSDECARAYEAELQRAYGATALDPAKPLFDVTLLGLGDDGHIASLIPGQPVLNERAHWVAAVAHGRPEPRLTLTYPVLESSARIAFLVAGAAKANALARARAGDADLPAGRLRPNGELVWFSDRAAAGRS